MEIINGLSALFVLLSFLAFIIGMIKPKFLKLKGRKQVVLMTLGAFIVFMVIFSFTQSEEQKAKMQAEATKKAQENILKEKVEADRIAKEKSDELKAEQQKKLEELKAKVNLSFQDDAKPLALEIAPILGEITDIEKAELTTKTLDIYLKAKPIWNEKQTVFDSGMKGAEIVSKLKEKGVTTLKTLRVHASAELLDQYDNKSAGKIFFIEYDFPEVLKLNSDSYVLYQPYLRFAKMNINHPVGRKAFNDWCQEESNISLSGSFCMN